MGWADILLPYCKNSQIFKCPSASTAGTRVGNSPNIYTSYGWNWRYLGSDTTTWLTYGLGDVTMPAETITYADSPSYVVSNFEFAYRPLSVHNEGANCGFVDGHAKWFKQSVIYSGTDTANGVSTGSQQWYYLRTK